MDSYGIFGYFDIPSASHFTEDFLDGVPCAHYLPLRDPVKPFSGPSRILAGTGSTIQISSGTCQIRTAPDPPLQY